MKNLRDLGFLELLTPAGKPVFFEDVWSGKITVLCLLRHFGCVFCFEQAHALLNTRTALEDAGAQLVLLGNGNPGHARDFMRHFGMTQGVYTDPARNLYRRLGLKHGMRATLNWGATQHARRARAAGFRGAGVQGDVWQQGATLVTAADGCIVFEHQSQIAGDHPSADAVRQGVRDARARATARG
ncbi:MAG: hypothetical protein RJA70_947 [Pseudomonadota bacterium]|jgi:peroxiredoxin